MERDYEKTGRNIGPRGDERDLSDKVTDAAERAWDKTRDTVETGYESAVDRAKDWGTSEYRFRRVLSAGTLTGDRVRNSAGEDLGKIEEIMLDIPSGRVAYAVLSFGGFLGIGDKLFAVPWNALTLNEQEKEFVLDVDRQTLENAPGFDKNNWPDFADPSWGAQIYSHYGQKPYWGSEFDTTERERSEVSSTIKAREERY